jgi:PPOX class probable F420-dependent enzyme
VVSTPAGSEARPQNGAARSRLTTDDLTFLDQARVARLATSNTAGQPHAVPVCFARLGDRLYVPVDAKPKRGDPRRLRRLRNLRERPAAALLVDHYDDDWARLRWLLIHAQATILDPAAVDDQIGREYHQALSALEQRYPQYAAMGLAHLGLPVIALRPTRVSRWRAAQPPVPTAGSG